MLLLIFFATRLVCPLLLGCPRFLLALAFPPGRAERAATKRLFCKKHTATPVWSRAAAWQHHTAVPFGPVVARPAKTHTGPSLFPGVYSTDGRHTAAGCFSKCSPPKKEVMAHGIAASMADGRFRGGL